jgi:DNA-binding CsgD family transcriptional regulator
MRNSALVYLAEACLRRGNVTEANELLGDVADAVLHEPRIAATRAILGHVAAELDDACVWQDCYDVLRAERRAMLFVYAPTSVQRVLGRLATKLREWPSAIEHFDIAVETLRTGKAWSELLLTLVDYAALRRCRGRRGDLLKAAALDAQACELAAKIGMPAGLQANVAGRGNCFGLTNRELEVLSLVGIGLRNRAIAERLTLSERTVQRHLENAFIKMGATGRADAVVKAAEQGLLFQPLPGKALQASS